ncbi:MAG TPA: PEPxxWA-CTERM sorting domain-containing protein [Sphingobium sp.]|nr:PEPxxWA-CTERM sorting domain-containing protein [Sphingobium sp.]
MFQLGSGLPGVFATLQEPGDLGLSQLSLRDRMGSAFFADLGRRPEAANGRNVISAQPLEDIGLAPRPLLYAGPDVDFIPLGTGDLTIDTPDLPGSPPQSASPPQSDPSYLGTPPSDKTTDPGGDTKSGDPRTDPDPDKNPVTPGTPTTAVPEPATWAMMILGFLGIGHMMRAARTRARLKAPSLTEG